MKQSYFYPFGIFMILINLMACSHDDEARLSEEGTFTIVLNDSYTLKEGNNNILTLTNNYPMLNVSSVFSLTAKAPEIVYMGQYSVLEQIPIETTEQFSTRAIIHNGGGYLIKTTLIKPETSDMEECIIKMLLRDGPKNETGVPEYIDVHYQFYRMTGNH